jgi:mono/diheme cytochrome c family protein
MLNIHATFARGPVAAILLAGALGFPAWSPAWAQSRGELLYTTHCVTCHSVQMHWREQRAANDWPSLTMQVRRWQGVASLSWSEDDIQDVARFLNDTIYQFQAPAGPSKADAGSRELPALPPTMYAQLAPRALHSLSAVPLSSVTLTVASVLAASSPAASSSAPPVVKPRPAVRRPLTPEALRDSGTTPGDLRPEDRTTPQIVVPLNRTQPRGKTAPAAQPSPINDEAARCEAAPTREARQLCLDKLARDSIDR